MYHTVTVHYTEREYKFKEHERGLYYFDTKEFKIYTEVSPYCLLSNVQDNKSYFTETEIEGVDQERHIQQEMGWPSITALCVIIKITSSQIQT